MSYSEGRLAPICLEVILWYYSRPVDFDRYEAPAAQEAMTTFVAYDLLEAGTDTAYRITPRGRAFVEMLCSIPFPTQKFINPLTKQVIE